MKKFVELKYSHANNRIYRIVGNFRGCFIFTFFVVDNKTLNIKDGNAHVLVHTHVHMTTCFNCNRLTVPKEWLFSDCYCSRENSNPQCKECTSECNT